MAFHEALDESHTLVDDATERWVRYIGPKFADENWRIFVAERGDELVGYVAAIIQDHPPVFVSTKHGFVETISVDEAHRRQGIGKRLVRAAENWLRSCGVPEITVRIDERNPASKALFASAGFEPSVVVRRKSIKE
jgi:GNAT superfamily N-acetyltransferase